MKAIEAESLAFATPLFREPRIWALLGPYRGDNNQALALAEALGLPFKTKLLQYNPRDLRHFWRALEDHGLAGSLEQSRTGPVPDLAVEVAQRVRAMLG